MHLHDFKPLKRHMVSYSLILLKYPHNHLVLRLTSSALLGFGLKSRIKTNPILRTICSFISDSLCTKSKDLGENYNSPTLEILLKLQ